MVHYKDVYIDNDGSVTVIKPEQMQELAKLHNSKRLFVWSSLNRDKYPQLNGLHAIQMLIAISKLLKVFAVG